MRDSVVFYRSFYDSIKNIPEEDQLKVYTAIMEYAMNDIQPEIEGIALAIFLLVKPQIDANNKRYQNGMKPKTKQPISKTEAKSKQNISENEAKEKEKENVKEKEKENVKDKTYTCAFEQLWNAYPRKKEKAKAYKCYKARLADGFSEDELLLAVKRYADECKKNHTDERYIKLGATFLGPNTPFLDYLEGGVTGDAERETRELTLSEELRREAANYTGDFSGFDESYDR